MPGLRFEWDEAKADSNARKHGISFQEAATVFEDEAAVLVGDPDHSDAEDRFILLGQSSGRRRLLVVVHCYREEDEVIRVISARRATRPESKQYTEVLL